MSVPITPRLQHSDTVVVAKECESESEAGVEVEE